MLKQKFLEANNASLQSFSNSIIRFGELTFLKLFAEANTWQRATTCRAAANSHIELFNPFLV